MSYNENHNDDNETWKKNCVLSLSVCVSMYEQKKNQKLA